MNKTKRKNENELNEIIVNNEMNNNFCPLFVFINKERRKMKINDEFKIWNDSLSNFVRVEHLRFEINYCMINVCACE